MIISSVIEKACDKKKKAKTKHHFMIHFGEEKNGSGMTKWGRAWEHIVENRLCREITNIKGL